jgi:large subunit ribosomal protein L30
MEAKKETPKHAEKGPNRGGKIAVVRIRNISKADRKIRETLRMLKLHKSHTCSVWDRTESILGMIDKAKDYVTYGEIDEETLKMLIEKRGKKGNEGKTREFHLNPPRGGFERKGIKHSFGQGGALGYRGKHINELIRKML